MDALKLDQEWENTVSHNLPDESWHNIIVVLLLHNSNSYSL